MRYIIIIHILLKDLFKSGIEIGKDMIGTMTNTLILAFTGSAFVTFSIYILSGTIQSVI